MSLVLHRLRDRAALLSVRLDGSDRAHPSAILEVDRDGGSIVLDALNDAEAHRLVHPGIELRASTHLEGALVEFTAPVLARQDTDLPCYRLAFPSTMVYEQLREHFRVPVTQLGLVTRLKQPAGPAMKGLLMNLSPAGAGIWLEPPVHGHLRPGDHLADCELELHGEALHFDLEVRQLRTSRRREGLYIGARFQSIDPAHKRRLERFIAEVQRERVLRQRA